MRGSGPRCASPRPTPRSGTAPRPARTQTTKQSPRRRLPQRTEGCAPRPSDEKRVAPCRGASNRGWPRERPSAVWSRSLECAKALRRVARTRSNPHASRHRIQTPRYWRAWRRAPPEGAAPRKGGGRPRG
eukprot:7035995-Prymnesium_polylepis.1